jgi:hypothetical protein
METRRLYQFLSALTVAWLGWCCHGRGVPSRLDAASPSPASPAPKANTETAAVLLVDAQGTARIVCLPIRSQQDDIFPSMAVSKVLDAVSVQGKFLVAATVGPAEGTFKHPGGKLLLLSSGVRPRTLGDGVRFAQFSPQGDALLFESTTRQNVGGGMMGRVWTSQVFDLTNDSLETLGEYSDPRWESDGDHVRATRLYKKLVDLRTHMTARWLSTRIRWDRKTRSVTTLGPGNAQIPAPHGTGLVWSNATEISPFSDRCPLSLAEGGQPDHPTLGRFCQGRIDDRAIRWSPDGHWVAFTSFTESTPNQPGLDAQVFLDILAPSGEHHPAISTLTSQQSTQPTAEFPWIDWSPSQRQLVVQRGDETIGLYDLGNQTLSFLGQGRFPIWSPRGQYILALTTSKKQDGEATLDAFALSGPSFTTRTSLGKVRDVRWINSAACAKKGDK